jgi:hypothetical protein
MSDANSAVERVPVEVWQLILQFAFTSTFFPFVDEGRHHLSASIIDNHDLFRPIWRNPQVYDDANYANYRSLRTVCRTWKALVDVVSDRCIGRYIYSDLSGSTYPVPSSEALGNAEMMHLVGEHLREYCFCGRTKACRPQYCASYSRYFKQKEEYWWNQDVRSLQTRLKNVKIVFLRDNSPASRRILKSTSNIRALYWDKFPYDPILFDPPNMKHITHLALSDIPCDQFFGHYFKGDLFLPSVMYLELSLTLARRTPPPTSNPSPFPSLKTLKIGGNIEANFKIIILDFFAMCGKTVTEFIEHRTGYRKGILPKAFPELSFYFPNLHLYGIGLHELFPHRVHPEQLANLSYSPTSSTFTLLLYDFLDTFGVQSEMSVKIMNVVRVQWNVSRIMMQERWTDLETRLKLSPESGLKSFLGNLKLFFEGLDSSLQFCDREGVTLSKATFHECQTWLDFLRGDGSL